jgi:hypothetical protein
MVQEEDPNLCKTLVPTPPDRTLWNKRGVSKNGALFRASRSDLFLSGLGRVLRQGGRRGRARVIRGGATAGAEEGTTTQQYR